MSYYDRHSHYRSGMNVFLKAAIAAVGLAVVVALFVGTQSMKKKAEANAEKPANLPKISFASPFGHHHVPKP